MRLFSSPMSFLRLVRRAPHREWTQHFSSRHFRIGNSVQRSPDTAISLCARRFRWWSQLQSLRRPRSIRFNSSSPHPPPKPILEAAEPPLSLSQRMKKLSREYGYSALGVYFLLSAVDFPFCFLAVRVLGTDRIGHWELVAMETLRKFIPWPILSGASSKESSEAGTTSPAAEPSSPHRVEEAERRNEGSSATIWTQLALAYAIHKSFIFIRVPLTAAVTPKVVRVLRSWGWDIGKKRSKRLKSGGSGK